MFRRVKSLKKEQTPTAQFFYAILLGSAKFLKNGRPNRYYRYRVEAAYNLFARGVVQLLFLSGGPQEVADMSKDLERMGVPVEALYPDPHGYRTYRSMIQYHNLFGAAPVYMVTQKFHMGRALRLAKKSKIEAYPWYAKSVSGLAGAKVLIREFFARGKMVLDLLSTPEQSMLSLEELLPGIVHEKEAVRYCMVERITSLGLEYRKEGSKRIVASLMDSVEYKRAKQVLLFYPMEEEVDLRPCIEDCWSRGVGVALPRMQNQGIEFFFVESYKDLELHPYGCMEPKDTLPRCTDELLQPDTLLLIPGLAYDPRAQVRLGRGKGYYDRFLLKLSHAASERVDMSQNAKFPELWVRMVCFQAQIVQGIPSDPWDIPITSGVSEVAKYGDWL